MADLDNLTLIDCTLREGEQYLSANFTSGNKLAIAGMLSEFGIRYLELTNPAASERSITDAKALVSAYPGTTFAAHIRCHPDDVRLAVESGVQALHMVMAISPVLRSASHKKGLSEVVETAIGAAELARSLNPDLPIRYSNEDAFRCPGDDLMAVYGRLSESGLFSRFGVADTTGVAVPDDVRRIVSRIRSETGMPVEWHGHNDCGCADANAVTAALAGADHINCSVLGLGERNGIASLEGLIAFLYSRNREMVAGRFDLKKLADLSRYAGDLVDVAIPFNHPLVGKAAFSHKAGIHLKAVLNDPNAYEALDPEDFGRERNLNFGHRLTGWNAIRVRSEALGLSLDQESLKQATRQIKVLADERETDITDVDRILQQFADGHSE